MLLNSRYYSTVLKHNTEICVIIQKPGGNKQITREETKKCYDYFEASDHLSGTEKDIFELYRRCKENGQIPELYQACGTKDFLYEMNLDAKKRLEKMGARLTYSETESATQSSKQVIELHPF